MLYDFDQTPVDTSPVESSRAKRDWKGVMAQVERLVCIQTLTNHSPTFGARGHRLAFATKCPDMVAKWFIAKNDWPTEI